MEKCIASWRKEAKRLIKKSEEKYVPTQIYFACIAKAGVFEQCADELQKVVDEMHKERKNK